MNYLVGFLVLLSSCLLADWAHYAAQFDEDRCVIELKNGSTWEIDKYYQSEVASWDISERYRDNNPILLSISMIPEICGKSGNFYLRNQETKRQVRAKPIKEPRAITDGVMSLKRMYLSENRFVAKYYNGKYYEYEFLNGWGSRPREWKKGHLFIMNTNESRLFPSYLYRMVNTNVQDALECKYICRISERERKHAAYHAAGHLVVGLFLDHSAGVDKVTIRPAEKYLCRTKLISQDEHFEFATDLKSKLIFLLAGYAAESLFTDNISTSVEKDLAEANDLAKKMICSYGQSERLGPLTDRIGYSLETRKVVEEETQNLLEEALDRAKQLITSQEAFFKRVVEDLLEKDTLYKSDIDRIVAEFS